jgi:Calcineurin-like phosphoesterase
MIACRSSETERQRNVCDALPFCIRAYHGLALAGRQLSEAVGNSSGGLEIGTKSEQTRQMAITFLHTADWQIGKSFGGFGDETAALLRAARLDAIDRMASIATAAGARHVLVAGDVFDSAKPAQRTIGQLLARLDVHAGLVWHLLPGNHDPAQPGSVWDDIAGGKCPANVRTHTSPTPVEIEPGVLLLPAPLHAKAMSTDPTAFMDQVVSPRGTIRIGMAHGSVRGFDSLGEAAIPIEPSRAKSAGLDYLALGDWHGLTPINERTGYSGTQEPDGYKDNKPGNVLVVRIDAQGALPDVRAISTQHYHWRRVMLPLTSLGDLERFAVELAGDAVPRARLVLKLDLTGRVPLADFGAIRACLNTLGDGLANLDADASQLETSTGTEDITALGAGSIGAIAQRLATMRDNGDASEQQTAGRALRTLARFVGQTP